VRPWGVEPQALVPGSLVGFRPKWLKRDLDPPEFVLAYQAEAHNPVHALVKYSAVCREFGQPLTGIVARVLTPDRRVFVERALGSSQLTARFKAYFAAVGVSYSVTTHGGRRGRYQALTRGGLSLAAAGEMAQIRTRAVQLRYNDPHGHRPCPLARVGRGQKRPHHELI